MALNILIVDDSDVIRGMITRTLRLANVPVGTLYEASNGREALSVMGEQWIDLVLADLNMPVMPGMEMLERMRTRPETAEIPVVIVSTEGATERVAELMDRGVAAWVRKPFTPEEIRDVVDRVTNRWDNPINAVMVDDILEPVLETFTFMSPEPVAPAELPRPIGAMFSATIAFTGATNGSVTIACPTSLCVEMAANVLGIDTDDPDALFKGADTLGEIANITAGHLTSTLEGQRPTDLHPPVVEQLSPAGWDALMDASGVRGFLVEEHPVAVRVGLRTRQLTS